jgi:pyruvoyl-dependent arginine decarboxylase (PvlArgDC)
MPDKLLDRLYYDPLTGFVGLSKMYSRAKQVDPKVKRSEVKRYLDKQELSQVFAPKAKLLSYPIYSSIPNAYQADLMFLKPDKGFKAVLTIINVNTRKGYVYALKTKTAKEVSEALSQFISAVKECHSITTDNGKEFLNTHVLRLLKKHNIDHYINQAGDHRKMGLIERFNRSLKMILVRYQQHNDTNEWYDVLRKIIINYNNSPHYALRGIGSVNGLNTPESITKEDEKELIWRSIQKTVKVKRLEKLVEGQSVRVMLSKALFAKEGKRWSEEIGVIVGKNGNKFQVEFEDKSIVEKNHNELKVVEAMMEKKRGRAEGKDKKKKKGKKESFKEGQQEVYAPEKIVDEKTVKGRKMYLIKWEGYSDRENTWEFIENIRLKNRSRKTRLEREWDATK